MQAEDQSRHSFPSVNRAKLVPVMIAALAAFMVGFMGATITDLSDWYRALAKPDWTPPDPAFGLAWTIIFAFTALSSVYAWRAAPASKSLNIIGLFAFNGFLNILWSWLFFRMQRPDWALFEVVALWLSIVALMVYCGRYSKAAAVLLIPYLAWVGLAAFLNYEIVQLNDPF